MLRNQFSRQCYFALIIWVWGGLTALSQSPLPKAMEHPYDEIKQAFDEWQAPEGDHAIEVLLEQMRLEYDERGAATQSRRRIWRLKSKQVSEYGVVEREFSPWFENQPAVQARVFDTNGREFKLSQDDVTFSPAGSPEQGLLSDRMVMRAALPGLRYGAIVEELVEVKEREPFFQSGSSVRFNLDALVPSKFLDIEIDSPEALPLQLLFRPERPSELQESENLRDGRRRVSLNWNSRTYVPIQTLENDAPRDVYQLHSLAINTGINWQQVASQYAQLIEKRLEAEPLQELVDEVLAENPLEEFHSIEEKVHYCATWIRHNIRYTGILLGDAAIVPARPSTVVGRRFGDCKDQSTLLVGLLRQLGVQADVALVNTAISRLPSPELPCLNSFDHAIVVVRHPSGDLWIDPTNPGSTPTCIPDYLQGRLAMIANPEQEELTWIPNQGLDGNQDLELRVMTITSLGNATIASESVQSGYLAADARSQASHQSFEEEAKALADHYAESGVSAQVALLHRSDPDLDEPKFVRKTEFRDVPLESLGENRFRVDLTFRNSIANCRFFHLIEKTDRGIAKPRRHAAECIVPYVWKRTYQLIPPGGYRIASLAQDHQVQIGPVELALAHRHLEDGSMTIEQTLRVSTGIISPEELQALSEISEKLESGEHPLNFSAVVEAEGDPSLDSLSALLNQLDESRQRWLTDPSGDTGYDYVASLVGVGQIEEARDVARGFVEKLPDEGMAHCAVAYSLLHDIVGREFGFDCDVRGAEQACRKAIELSPHRWQPYYLLSLLVDVDDRGVHQNNPKALNEMLDILDAAQSRGVQVEQLIERKVAALIRLNRLDEAVALASQYGLGRLQNVAKAVKASLESRWGDIVAMRERIPSSSEREMVGAITEQFLLSEREYEKSPRVVLLFRGMTDRDIENWQKGRPKVQAVERPADPNHSPETVVREFLLRIVSQGNHPDAWPDIVSNCGVECLPTLRLVNLTESLRTKLFMQKAAVDRIYDVCSLYPLRVEGNDEQGYMARIKLPIECDIAVVEQDGRYKILLSGTGFRDYALRAQQFLNEGKTELAIRWIDWALRGQSDGVLLNPETGHPVKRFWGMTRKKTSEAIQLVIEMLLAGSDLTLERRQLILNAAASEKSAIKRQWMHLSLQMNPKFDGPELGEILRSYVDSFPTSTMGRMRLASYEAMHGKFDLAEEYTRETDNVQDPARMEFVDMLRFEKGDVAEILEERAKQAVQEKSMKAWNSCLWAGLFADKIEEQWLEGMREVLKPTPETKDQYTNTLHTLCCAEAQFGDIDRAVANLSQLVDLRGNCIDNVDYWILGRIAEQCQLPERARRYYERVTPSANPASTYRLARRRLSILDSNPPKAPVLEPSDARP